MHELQARANLAALLPHYDSHLEAWWAVYGPLLMANELRQAVALSLYHPLTFHVPGGAYTPDFLHILAEDGALVAVEVKALIVDGAGKNNSRAQRGYRDARTKLRAAADVYRWLIWYEARIGAHDAVELERITNRD
jgi:hypothetical protein